MRCCFRVISVESQPLFCAIQKYLSMCSEWQECPEAEMFLVGEGWISLPSELFFTIATVFGTPL